MRFGHQRITIAALILLSPSPVFAQQNLNRFMAIGSADVAGRPPYINGIFSVGDSAWVSRCDLATCTAHLIPHGATTFEVRRQQIIEMSAWRVRRDTPQARQAAAARARAAGDSAALAAYLRLPPARRWRLDSTQTEIDDRPIMLLTRPAENNLTDAAGRAHATMLTVRCRDHAISVFVGAGIPLSENLVRLRLGRGETRVEAWESLTSGTLASPRPRAMAFDITTVDTVRIQLSPLGGSPQIIRFDVSQATPFVARLFRVCGVSFRTK